jgi:hypothetical protein
MADDKDHRPNNQSREWPDESNPFVAFRRYADEQVSTMLQSITGLPSTVTPPHNDRWEIFADDHGYESRISHQRTGDNADRGYPNDGDRGRDDRDLNSANNPRKWYNGPSDLFSLDSLFLPFASNIFHPQNLFSDMFEDTESPTWPITYIMFSPYSPLNLERQAKFRTHRENGVFSSIMSSLYLDSDRDPSEPQWREAFEDLLRLENGKSMLNRDSIKSESGKDWLQGLVKRGSLGDRWKYISDTEGQPWSGITFSGRTEQQQRQQDRQERPRPGIENDTREGKETTDTELDLYERFLNDIEDREREFSRSIAESPLLRLLLAERKEQQEELEKYRSGTQSDEHSDDNENWIDLVSGGNKKSVLETPQVSTETQPESLSEPEKSRVVSTMTRTEHVHLADGSLQSTIIKSKRFADGREENDTSIEVSHPQSEGPDSGTDKSKSGWFWRD